MSCQLLRAIRMASETLSVKWLDKLHVALPMKSSVASGYRSRPSSITHSHSAPGQVPDLSVPAFLVIKWKDSGNCLTGLLGGSNELIHTKYAKQCLKQILNQWAMLLLLVLSAVFFSCCVPRSCPGLRVSRGHLCLGSYQIRRLSSWLFSSFIWSYRALVSSDSLSPQKYNPDK